MSGSASQPIWQRIIDNKQIIANAIGFQLVWFVCVQGNSIYAVIAALALLVLYHLTFRTNLKTWKALCIFSVLGYLGDGVIAYAFQLNYAEVKSLVPSSISAEAASLSTGSIESTLPPLLAPLWLLSLWVAFATTLNHSMKWILKTPLLTTAIALFLVPLSYLAGIKFSNSQFMVSSSDSNIVMFFLVEGLWWALLLSAYKKTESFNTNSVISHE